MLKFTNPRVSADFSDWPSVSARVKCEFRVHFDVKRGYRFSRRTTDKSGKWCKPKLTTFGGQGCIVDGDDGKKYLLQAQPEYGFVSVRSSDFMDAPAEVVGHSGFAGSSVFQRDEPELHQSLLALIVAGGALQLALVAKAG